jgi:RimJ/RimL family protein N-acetyltransferase
MNTNHLLNLFETQRLKLRPVKPEDAEFYFHLMTSPKWLQFIGDRHLKSREDAAIYIEHKMLPAWDKNGFGSFTVIRREDDEKIGTCGLFVREELKGVDLGFAFLSQYEGQGYAYEATSKIKEVAFEVFHLSALLAIALPDNTASLKLLKKLGFRQVGTTVLPGDSEELLMLKAYPQSFL